ncbi:TonB-dependent receptor [Pseudomarimonas arenosa]|uniref:TonB-dependent receptor n=1 Tax=Pseudomarimonas arenosa TaxID=2774145 RepID=A0AAW3ZM47_9GAMM|nr:TonB-dependent receptor [Pseudomarimonas arenosa]MBD8526808.1 TonB-dependent receptor [Pseudomarimonas arenosa]
MKARQTPPKRHLLTAALLFAMAQPGWAQDQADNSKSDDEATELDAVEVKGILGSLASSMNLKRDSQGVVDGIVAEDMGKFPDTNLAESLQRISGVSIDRSIGEGARVTVRGVGPDFNLVLLNGRQMPASSIQETGPSNSRAFDFANLASEAIAEIEVYKTSRASTPTGGIGATINIKTAKPLENPGLHANIGLKGVMDTSVDNLPDALQGDTWTPEVSGIFSNTFADGRFGIAVTGSYQERDLGYNQAAVPNGWRAFRGDENNWGTIPQPGTPGSENITNRPGPTDIYSVPQNLVYSVNGLQRERTNGQLVLQYQPVDNVTATLDYTYSELKLAQQRNELSVWFNYGPSASSWTNGPVAAPNVYSEIIVPATSDLAMGGADFATRNENDSLGFNLDWDVTDQLSLAFDVHKSTAESGADSPFGSNSVIGTAGFFRGTTTVDFTQDFPVLSVDLPPGMTAIDPAGMLVTGSSFRNSYMKAEVEQYQTRGTFQFEDYSRLDFGVSLTDVDNRSAFSNVQRDTWGGATNAGDYPDSVWIPDSIRHYFRSMNGSGNPNLFNQFFTWDFRTVRDLAAQAAGDGSLYLVSPDFTTDRRVNEESKSAYLQWSTTWEMAMPLDIALGVRYEETDVTSTALVPTATSITWVANNEFSVQFADPDFTTLTGKYDYLLPNLDLALHLNDQMLLRGSYGESIGRPGWGDIQGGQTINQLVRIDGGGGAQGNPGLKPLESQNFDLSFEWYYAESSYLAVGYFRKNIDNYIGVTTIDATPFNLNTPAGGAYFNAAVQSGCATSDLTCIRNYIFLNFNGQPGVTRGPDDANGNQTGTIVGQPGDPIANFRITVPANQQSASLDGWEFNIQHAFGDSGFGVAANYTIVDSGLTYDNYSLGEQFALEGLSDSANLVLFYDKGPWQARAAYNWRDEFLAGRFDGTGLPNPVYVEAYGQLDMNVSYQWNEKLSLSLEAINLTDETTRSHGRHPNQVLYATQTGPRYMLGLRYRFR